MESPSPKVRGTHVVEALIEVEADDARDATHVVLGLMADAIRHVRVTDVAPVATDDAPPQQDGLSTEDIVRLLAFVRTCPLPFLFR